MLHFFLIAKFIGLNYKSNGKLLNFVPKSFIGLIVDYKFSSGIKIRSNQIQFNLEI
jgi:hypothetical protein